MRNQIALAGVCALLFIAGDAIAQDRAAPAPAPAPVSKFLSPGELDPAVLLPPPAKDGAPQTLAELADLHRVEAERTPERFAQAKQDDEIEDVRSIADVFGPAFDLQRFPATAQLFADLRNEDSVAAKRAKAYFQRTRPWHADPTLNPCNRSDAIKSAYPSGHSTMGYASAEVLANLMPGNAQIILARASDYADSRLVCGAHYRSDLEAGHVLATALVAELMTKPAFRAELEAARAELTAAHIAP